MPFTFAHPALVVPLAQTRHQLSLTGLVIGSMVPDLEFFVQLREVENIGHHGYGILLFDLPVALLLCFLFHNLLRNPLLANLPEPLRRRFFPLRRLDWNRYARANPGKVIGSILIGVASHFAWDAFTHHDGTAVTWLPALSRDLYLLGYTLPVYFLLQIGSSLLGLVVVYLQLLQMPVRQREIDVPVDYRYWMTFSLLFATIAALRLIGWPEYNSFGGVAIALMGSGFYSWLAVSLLFHPSLTLRIRQL